jgi:hypothetical protein
MRTILGIKVPETVSDMLSDAEWSNAYYDWSAANSNDFINCPDRAARCYDAAANGCDGSTHAENIDDFREYGNSLFFDLNRKLENAIDGNEMWDDMDQEAASDLCNSFWEQFEACEQAYSADVDALEDWHDKNGSLNQQVG